MGNYESPSLVLTILLYSVFNSVNCFSLYICYMTAVTHLKPIHGEDKIKTELNKQTNHIRTMKTTAHEDQFCITSAMLLLTHIKERRFCQFYNNSIRNDFLQKPIPGKEGCQNKHPRPGSHRDLDLAPPIMPAHQIIIKHTTDTRMC